MSVEVLAVLACCLIIAFAFTRKTAQCPFPGSLSDLLLMSFCTWHILPELIFLVFGQQVGRYRDQLLPEAIDAFGLLLGISLLLFSVGYSTTGKRRVPCVRSYSPRESSLGSGVWALAFACLLVVGMQGGLAFNPSADTYLMSGLSMTMYPVVAALGIADLATLFRSPVLGIATTAVAMGAIGSRTSVALPTFCAIVIMNRYGLNVSKRTLLVAGAVLATVLGAISAVRATGNRHEIEDDLDSRIEKLASAFVADFGSGEWHRVADDFGYRFDCNSFAALILQQQLSQRAHPAIALEISQTAWTTLLPAALSPMKGMRRPEELNEEERIILSYNLPPDDYLPGPFSSAIACGGAIGVCVLGFFAGVALGVIESGPWRIGATGLALYAGVCAIVMTSSANLQGMLVQARSVIMFLAVVWLLDGFFRELVRTFRPCAMANGGTGVPADGAAGQGALPSSRRRQRRFAVACRSSSK